MKSVRFLWNIGRGHLLKPILRKDSRRKTRNDDGVRVANAATSEVRQDPSVSTTKHS
jgi:hypothetical protein